MLARSAFKPRKRNAPRPTEKSCRGFLQWIRGRCCACGGRGCAQGSTPIVAAHVDHAGGKGMGTKVADRHAIPLSDECHRRQHSIGWRRFERHFLAGGDAVKLAEVYWRAWPGRLAWEKKNEQ